MSSHDAWEQAKQTIKERIGIVDLVRRDVPGLRQSGSCWRGDEQMDSLIVWQETQTWRRFSTQEGGDIFSWLMVSRGISFGQALSELAREAGVELPAGSGNIEEDDELRAVEALLTRAAGIMHSKMGRRDFRALEQRYGITRETVDRLLIGKDIGSLFDEMSGYGTDRKDLLSTGLFVPTRDGEQDFFEGRIVFPYWRAGRVCYMIGRRTDETPDEPWERGKYKKLPIASAKREYVSPYIRNSVFYNEDAARRSCSTLLVTEGVTDCIAAMQAGIPCISPVTVRFAHRDIPKLRALTGRAERVVICNDAEDTGRGDDGAISTALALWPERDIRIAEIPRAPGDGDKVDVNDYLREHGAAAFRRVLADAARLPEWMVDRIPRDAEPSDRTRMIDSALRAALPMPEIERGPLLARIADRFSGLGRRAVRARMAEIERTDRAGDDDGEGRPGRDAPMAGEIHEAVNHYYAFKGEEPVAVSSFAVKVTHRAVVDGDQMICGDATTRDGKRIVGVMFSPSAWTGRRSLVTALGRISPDLQWTGTDAQVQGLLARLAGADVPVRAGVSVVGRADGPEGPRWVWPGGSIGALPEEDDDESIVFVPTGGPMEQRVDYPPATESEVRATAAEALPAMAAMNEPAVALPAIGWFFASFYRAELDRLLGHFPMLVAWGSPASGKTSLCQVMSRAVGIAGAAEPFSSTETEFATLRILSGTNGAPVWFDEYKPADMPQRAVARLHRFLRRLYAGERETRGRADLSVRTFRLSAPAVLSGESRPEETALVERSIVISPRRGSLEDPTLGPGYREAFSRLRMSRPELLARALARRSLSTDTRELLAASRELACSALTNAGARRVPPRVEDNIAVMFFGLLTWERFAAALGVNIPDIEDATARAVEDMMAEVAPAQGAAADEVDRFMEDLAALAHAGALERGVHYTTHGGRVQIYLRAAYQVYLERRRSSGRPDGTNGMLALKRMIREKADEDGGYIVDASRRVTLEGKRQVRCVEIDPSPAVSRTDLDLDGWPADLNDPRFAASASLIDQD